jgi:hypothetical protein
MSKGSPAPWFRKSRNSWFVTFGGKQLDLQTADRKEAFQRWHQLALNVPAVAAAVPQLSVRELLAQFLEATQKRSRPSTYYWYSYFLHSFARTIPKQLLAADLRSFRVTQWLDKRDSWGVNSRRAAIRTVKRAFQWGVEEGYLEFSPVAGLKKPAGNPPTHDPCRRRSAARLNRIVCGTPGNRWSTNEDGNGLSVSDRSAVSTPDPRHRREVR